MSVKLRREKDFDDYVKITSFIPEIFILVLRRETSKSDIRSLLAEPAWLDEGRWRNYREPD
jgi:hypothetical protein